MPISDEELKKVFTQIDTDNSGSISEKELREAMRALGVRVSGNSARRVLAMIDKDGNGTIEWTEFQAFFGKVSNPDEIKKLLSVENQRFFEYKLMVESDPSFAKTFVIPPLVPHERKLESHTSDVQGVSWLSDTRLISACIDGLILLWDFESNKSAKKLMPSKYIQSSSIYSMAASPEGTHVLTGHGMRSDNLKLWSIEEGTAVSSFKGLHEPVYSCSYTPSESSFVAGGKSGGMCVYNVLSESPTHEWKGHTGVVQSIDFRRDSNHVLCSASRDGTVKIFDTRKAPPDCVFEIEDAAASGAVNQALWRHSTEIIACGDDYCIKRWDVRQSGRGPVSSYFGHSSVVRTIALSPDGRFLVSGTQSGSVRVWLADEVGMFEHASAKVQARKQKLQAMVDELEELNSRGEGDLDDLKSTVKQFQGVEEELAFLRKAQSDREIMACTQAKLGLDGPTLPINTLAWRDTGDSSGCIACGCQDSSVRTFSVNTRDLARLSPWDQTDAN